MILLFLLQGKEFIFFEHRFEKPEILKVELNNEEYYRIEGDEYIIIPGNPLIPLKTFSYLLPDDAVDIDVSVKEIKAETIFLSLPLFPAQKPVPFIENWSDFCKITRPSEEIYSEDKFIPEKRIEFLNIGYKNGFKIVSISLFPFRYNPYSSLLELTKEIKICISYNRDGKRCSLPNQKIKNMAKNFLMDFVYNKDDIERFSPLIKKQVSKLLPSGDYDYIIISGDNAFVETLKRLAEWKRKKGLKTKIITTDWIYSNYSGYDKAEKVRNFIKDAYSNWGSIWFLLCGQGDWEWEEEYFPRRDLFYAHLLMPVYYPDQETIPGDIYFSNLDGNWDFNNNHIYGEEGDSVDFFSDVFVGRLPCKDVEDVENMVNKIIFFEKNSPPSYVKRILLPASLLFPPYNWWGDSVNNAISNMTPPGWDDIKLYQSSGNLTQKGIIDTLNSGVQFTHYALHGGPGAVGDADGNVFLSIWDIDTLHNGNYLSIQTGISCFTGALDEVWWDDNDCFAEHFLTKIDQGGVASIMNSRFGWGNPASGKIYFSEAIDTTFYHQIFKKGIRRLGEALQRTKDIYGARATFDSLWVWCLYELNLFGDPELSVWTDTPKDLSVFHPEFILNGITNFTISVYSNSIPVDSAIVCCMMDTIVYSVETTDASGNANFSLNIPFSGDMEITVTGKNLIPYEGKIKVIGRNNIEFLRYEVFDTIGYSDRNSEINSGEIVDIPLWIKNLTTNTYTNIRGRIKTLSSFINVLKDSVSFINLYPEDSTISDGAFRIEVSSSTPEEFFSPCSLILTKDADTFSSFFFLKIKGKKIIKINPGEIVFDYRYKFLKSSSYLDTLLYDDGNPVKQIYFSTYPYMGVRFVPNLACTLLQALIGREPIITNFYDKLFLREDNGGLPGAIIDSFFYTPDKYADSGFTEVPLFNPYRPYVFERPFWIIVNDQGTSNGTLLGDGTGSGNSFVSSNGSIWQSYNSDFLIRALVKSFTPKSLTDSSCFWIKNEGTATITIKNIILKNNSPWFYCKSPEFLAVFPGESSKVVVRIDTISLSKEENYFDTLMIYSDAVYESKSFNFLSLIPVSILYKSIVKSARVSLLNYAIFDTVDGSDRDGIIEPGEIIDIAGTIKNIGDTIGYSIIGRYIDNDEYTINIDSTEEFGDIQPIEEKSFLFRISISPSTPLGHLISAKIFTKDLLDSVWEFPINLLVGKGPVISFSVDSITFDYTRKKISKSSIDTIKYDAGPLWDISTYSYYGVRFSPASLCSLKSALVCIDNVLGYSGDTIILMDDNGGIPGTIIEKKSFIPGTGSNIWNKIDFTSGYVDNNDFWIVAKIRTTYQSMNNDQGDATINGRSYYSLDGSTWTKNTTSDFCIRGIVSYFTPATEWNDTGFVFVKNIGDTTLKIDSVRIKNNSNWIISFFPDSGSVLKGDSIKVSVVIDTSGLSPLRYSDTLIFYTNAIGIGKGTRAGIPVILNLNPLGIEMISLNLFNERDGVLITWNKGNEIEGEKYIIRRKDCEWNNIGEVKIRRDYSFIYSYKDRNVERNKEYFYQVGLKKISGDIVWSESLSILTGFIPDEFSFSIMSNIVSDNLIITYELPQKTDVNIKIINITGRIEKSIDIKQNEPGFYIKKINECLPQGLYFIKLEAGGFEKTSKIVIVR